MLPTLPAEHNIVTSSTRATNNWFLDLASHYPTQELHTNLSNSMSANSQYTTTKKKGDSTLGANCDYDGQSKCPSIEISTETEEQNAFYRMDASKADEETRDTERNDLASSVPSTPSVSKNWDSTLKYPWLVPHISEYQKHAWHTSSLGMCSQKVKDEWGFHSTSVSRSHSPSSGKTE